MKDLYIDKTIKDISQAKAIMDNFTNQNSKLNQVTLK